MVQLGRWLSYSKLVDIWIEELTSPNLVDLPDQFYAMADSFIADLRKEANIREGILKTILTRQAEICEELVDEISKLRAFKKFVLSISKNLPLENIPESERRHLKSIVEHRKELPKPEESSPDLVQVIFKKSIPSIVGIDLRVYGPFKEGDVALIPRKNAVALEAKGYVEVVE